MEQIKNLKTLKDKQVSNDDDMILSRTNHKSVYFACKEGERIRKSKKQPVVIYFDFSKIFDTISHNNFISKFKKQGLD